MSNFRNHEKEWLDNLVLDESRETYRSMNAKQQTIVRFAFEYAYRLQETKVKEARTIAEKGQYQADYFAIRDALDVSKIRNNMFEQQLQQAHRAAEESAKDAHRRGWEQCKKQLIEEWSLPWGLSGGKRFDERMRSMEYKDNTLNNWCEIEGIAP